MVRKLKVTVDFKQSRNKNIVKTIIKIELVVKNITPLIMTSNGLLVSIAVNKGMFFLPLTKVLCTK